MFENTWPSGTHDPSEQTQGALSFRNFATSQLKLSSTATMNIRRKIVQNDLHSDNFSIGIPTADDASANEEGAVDPPGAVSIPPDQPAALNVKAACDLRIKALGDTVREKLAFEHELRK